MEIRKTTMKDFDIVLEIYAQARQFMKDHGNPHQWGDNRPSKEQISDDIRHGCSYVCVEDGQILGVFYYAKTEEPTYAHIYDGAWLNQLPYGVVHRIAAPGGRKGTASFCLNWCMLKSGGNIRIDTHQDNLPMQRMLEKNGFVKCGIIRLTDGDLRLAYQKSLHHSKI